MESSLTSHLEIKKNYIILSSVSVDALYDCKQQIAPALPRFGPNFGPVTEGGFALGIFILGFLVSRIAVEHSRGLISI